MSLEPFLQIPNLSIHSYKPRKSSPKPPPEEKKPDRAELILEAIESLTLGVNYGVPVTAIANKAKIHAHTAKPILRKLVSGGLVVAIKEQSISRDTYYPASRYTKNILHHPVTVSEEHADKVIEVLRNSKYGSSLTAKEIRKIVQWITPHQLGMTLKTLKKQGRVCATYAERKKCPLWSLRDGH